MHGAYNTCGNAYHTLRKKCICARACAHMQRSRSFFAMEAIANLSWVLREHRAGYCLPPALAAPPAVSTKPDARHCSLKKSVQIYTSSWCGRRCGVAQASFDHPHSCRPHPVCLWVALALGHGAHSSQKSIFATFRASFSRKAEPWKRVIQIGQRNKLQYIHMPLLRANISRCDTLDSTNLYVLWCVYDCVSHVTFDQPTMTSFTTFFA